MMTICRRRGFRPKTRLSRQRLMHTTGHNMVAVGVPDWHKRYLSDLYTTLIDIQWRWNILIFVSGFVLTWLLFACLYYLMGYLHGDMEDQDEYFTPCVENVKSFTAAYLFSIETMTTIGYGFRSQTEACPVVTMAVMLQSIIGAGLQFALASLVVSKTRRAKRRSETILFSDQVCLYEQDSRLQLAVRVGDMRRSEMAGAHAQGFLIRKMRSKEGTLIPVRSYNVALKAESGRDEIFFPWPTQILHRVDEDSPLWALSRDELLQGMYELIVVIDGVNGTTSRPFQARKSYHTWEMKWGYRFAALDLTFNSSGTGVMNLANFHHIVPASTPLCSAQDITNLREMYSFSHSETSRSAEGRLRASQSYGGLSSACDVGTSTDLTDSSGGPDSSVPTSPERSSRRSQRSLSLEEARKYVKNAHRRCSLGDMIRQAQGGEILAKKNSLGDALNIYKHRRSITDTYLGAEIEEEPDDIYASTEAILTVLSQRSADKRTDVRDVFKRRRSSMTQLFFGPEPDNSGDERDEHLREQNQKQQQQQLLPIQLQHGQQMQQQQQKQQQQQQLQQLDPTQLQQQQQQQQEEHVQLQQGQQIKQHPLQQQTRQHPPQQKSSRRSSTSISSSISSGSSSSNGRRGSSRKCKSNSN